MLSRSSRRSPRESRLQNCKPRRAARSNPSANPTHGRAAASGLRPPTWLPPAARLSAHTRATRSLSSLCSTAAAASARSAPASRNHARPSARHRQPCGAIAGLCRCARGAPGKWMAELQMGPAWARMGVVYVGEQSARTRSRARCSTKLAPRMPLQEIDRVSFSCCAIAAYPQWLIGVSQSNLVHGDGFLVHDSPLPRHRTTLLAILHHIRRLLDGTGLLHLCCN
ncbi:hypothetical protein ACP70R_017150 [Stipagrostis hirtigluma subsp. patula]